MATAVHLTYVLNDDEQIHVTVETDADAYPDQVDDLGNRTRSLLRDTLTDVIGVFDKARAKADARSSR